MTDAPPPCPYSLLKLEYDATEKDINTAYRKLARTCHPDRNPDDPKAAEKFDALTNAKDTLLDANQRRAIDQKREAEIERKKRYEKQDAGRRKLREELERREAEALKPKPESEAAKLKRIQRETRTKLKQAGREAFVRQAAATSQPSPPAGREDVPQPVRIRWKSEGSAEALREEIRGFGLLSLEAQADGKSALLTFVSREKAIIAVLHCKKTGVYKATLEESWERKRPAADPMVRTGSPPKVARCDKHADLEEDTIAALKRAAARQKEEREAKAVSAAPPVIVLGGPPEESESSSRPAPEPEEDDVLASLRQKVAEQNAAKAAAKVPSSEDDILAALRQKAAQQKAEAAAPAPQSSDSFDDLEGDTLAALRRAAQSQKV